MTSLREVSSPARRKRSRNEVLSVQNADPEIGEVCILWKLNWELTDTNILFILTQPHQINFSRI